MYYLNIGNLKTLNCELELNIFLNELRHEKFDLKDDIENVSIDTLNEVQEMQIGICNKKNEIYKVIYLKSLSTWVKVMDTLITQFSFVDKTPVNKNYSLVDEVESSKVAVDENILINGLQNKFNDNFDAVLSLG